jgi:hypothetical protein
MDGTNNSLLAMVVGLVARHALTALAGTLVTLGLVDKSQSSNFVEIGVGIAIGGAAIAWSWWRKVGHARALELLDRARGGAANDAAKIAAKVAIILCLLALAAPAFAAGANASGPSSPLSPLASLIGGWTAEHIAEAEKLAAAIEGLQDPIGKACWQSFANIGAVLKAHPLPLTLKIAPDIEAARLFFMAVKQVCANPYCTQLWADIANQVGALAPIPAPISLQAVCAKIP